MDSLISPGLYFTYALILIALAACILMPAFQAIKNPASLVKSLIGIVGLVVLFGVSYALSGSEVTLKAAANGISSGSSKLIGAGLIMFYIILVVSAVLVVVSMIRDIIKG